MSAALLDGTTAAGAVLVLSLVAALGLALGRVRVRGVGLGIAGVLFVGIAFGHFGVHVEERTREFVRELGLVFFVYSIGLQVGPGFLASLRRHGLRLNLLAASVVVLGVATALVLRFAGGIEARRPRRPPERGDDQHAEPRRRPAGPQGGAARPRRPAPPRRSCPALGYAVAYPFGVLGIILVMVAVRAAFRVSIQKEADDLERSRAAEAPPLARANLEVANPNLEGMALERVPSLAGSGIVVSRVFQDGDAAGAAAGDARCGSGTCCSRSARARSSTRSGSWWGRRAASTCAGCRAPSPRSASSSPGPPPPGRRSRPSTSPGASACRSRG